MVLKLKLSFSFFIVVLAAIFSSLSSFASVSSGAGDACEKALTSSAPTSGLSTSPRQNVSQNKTARAEKSSSDQSGGKQSYVYQKALEDLARATIKIARAEASGEVSSALLKSIEKEILIKRAELKSKMGELAFDLAFEKALEEVASQESTVVSKKRQARKKQIKVEKEYLSNWAVMNRVEPGSFKMGNSGQPVDVTLTKPFEMMSTPMTQIIWRKIADLAARELPGQYEINPDPSDFKGDAHPVESVSYDDIQLWLAALNELSAAGEPALSAIIRGHKQGDIYRLPTEAEWEFVVRGRGEFNGAYNFGDSESELQKYAWYRANSGSQTQSVGLKEPLVVDGQLFYDMYGNVFEWVQDWDGDHLSGGTDPQGPDTGWVRVIRGGAWSSPASHVGSAARSSLGPGRRYFDIGFRLVRTAE